MRRRAARRGCPPRARRGGSRDPATSGRCFKRPGRGGTVPSPRGEAGPKTFGARKRVFRNNGEGRPSMRARCIRRVCYTNTSPGGRDDDTPGDCKAVQGPEDPRRRVHRAVPDSLQRRKNAHGDRWCGPWRRRGRALSIPTSGLPSYETRQTTTAPPGLGQESRPGRLRRSSRGFRQGCRSPGAARPGSTKNGQECEF